MRFRFHLSTWIVLFLAASILLGLHISPQKYQLKVGGEELKAVTYGFPLICYEHQTIGTHSESTMDGSPIALFNFLIVLLPIAFLLEPESRRVYSLKSARGMLALIIAISIGIAVGNHFLLSIEQLNSSYSSNVSHDRLEYKFTEHYRKGWPISVYAGSLRLSVRGDEYSNRVLFVTSESTEAQTILLNRDLPENQSPWKQLAPEARFELPLAAIIGNLIAALFLTATIFILVHRVLTWLSRRFKLAELPPESPT